MMRKITLTADEVRRIKLNAEYGWPVDGDPSPYGEGVDWAIGCPNEFCCPCCGCDCDDMDDWINAEDVGKERWYDDEEV